MLSSGVSFIRKYYAIFMAKCKYEKIGYNSTLPIIFFLYVNDIKIWFAYILEIIEGCGLG